MHIPVFPRVPRVVYRLLGTTALTPLQALVEEWFAEGVEHVHTGDVVIDDKGPCLAWTDRTDAIVSELDLLPDGAPTARRAELLKSAISTLKEF